MPRPAARAYVSSAPPRLREAPGPGPPAGGRARDPRWRGGPFPAVPEQGAEPRFRHPADCSHLRRGATGPSGWAAPGGTRKRLKKQPVLQDVTGFLVCSEALLNPVPRFTQDTAVPQIVSCIINKDIHQCGTTIPDLSLLRVIGLHTVEFVEPLLSVKPAQEISVNVC